jgi:hypothetical protein
VTETDVFVVKRRFEIIDLMRQTLMVVVGTLCYWPPLHPESLAGKEMGGSFRDFRHLSRVTRLSRAAQPKSV